MKSFQDYLRTKIVNENNYYIKPGKMERRTFGQTDVLVDTESQYSPLVHIHFTEDKAGISDRATILFTQEFADLNSSDEELAKIMKVIINHCAKNKSLWLHFNDQIELPPNLQNVLNRFVQNKVIRKYPENSENQYVILGKEALHEPDDKNLMPDVMLRHDKIGKMKGDLPGGNLLKMFHQWLDQNHNTNAFDGEWQALTKKFEDEFKDAIKKFGSHIDANTTHETEDLFRKAKTYWNTALYRKWPAYENILVRYLNVLLYQENESFIRRLQDHFLPYYEKIDFTAGDILVNNIIKYYLKDNPESPDGIPKYYSDPSKRIEPAQDHLQKEPYINYLVFFAKNNQGKYPKFYTKLRKVISKNPQLGKILNPPEDNF